MDPTIQINEKIDVVVVYRSNGTINMLSLPRKMRWRNHDIDLTEVALRHPTIQGKRMIHVYHVSDGVNGYRLEFDAEALTWILISLLSGEDHA
jgi:hypothetical protein